MLRSYTAHRLPFDCSNPRKAALARIGERLSQRCALVRFGDASHVFFAAIIEDADGRGNSSMERFRGSANRATDGDLHLKFGRVDHIHGGAACRDKPAKIFAVRFDRLNEVRRQELDRSGTARAEIHGKLSATRELRAANEMAHRVVVPNVVHDTDERCAEVVSHTLQDFVTGHLDLKE